MHYFTKQMCQGGPRYGPGVRIGNWNEDTELSETTQNNFLYKRETGLLKLDAYHQRMSEALAPVDLKPLSSDGLIRLGDVVQIFSSVSDSAVSCDQYDKDARVGESACAVTCQPRGEGRPCARNTFTLSKYVPERPSVSDLDFGDDVLRYGQKIRVHMSPDYSRGEQWQLFSRMVCTTHYAKHTRHQLVGMTTRRGYETVWQVVTPNPEERIVSEGIEVTAGAPVNLIHCATNTALHLEDVVYENDFGRELEVSAHTAHGHNKRNNCQLDSTGSIRAAVPKPMTNANVFYLVNGAAPAASPPPQ